MAREAPDLWRLPQEDAPYGAIIAYEVTLRGRCLGVVSKHQTTSHRMAGRLIAATFHPERWAATPRGEPMSLRDAYMYTRRDAVERLLRHDREDAR
jgi:hypothetical protein